MIVSNNLAIHGWSPMASLMPANGTNSLPNSQFIGIDSTGKARKCLTTYIYDDVMCMLFDDIETTPGEEYDLAGTCAPVSSIVRVSDATKIDFDNFQHTLDSSVIASVEASDNGSFSFASVKAPSTSLLVWITTQPLELMTASLTCLVNGIEDDTGDTGGNTGGSGGSSGGSTETTQKPEGKLVYVPFTFNLPANTDCDICGGAGKYTAHGAPCSNCGGTGSIDGATCQVCSGSGYATMTCNVCNGTGQWSLTSTSGSNNYTISISGTCPSDATNDSTNKHPVCVSTYDPNTEPTSDMLWANRRTTASVSIGTPTSTFSLTITGVLVTSTNNFVLWTTTDTDSPITITNITATEQPKCLSGDTLITMSDGSVKELKDVVIGDMVRSQTGNPVRVMNNIRGYYNTYHTLYHFEDGTTIDETQDHRFYNVEQGFWQILNRWKIGEHAVSQNGEHVALISKERIDETVEMFGIWTEDGTYFANGLLSGSGSSNQKLLETATAEQAVDMIMTINEKQLIGFMGLDGALV